MDLLREDILARLGILLDRAGIDLPVEVIDVKDVELTGKLIAEFVKEAE